MAELGLTPTSVSLQNLDSKESRSKQCHLRCKAGIVWNSAAKFKPSGSYGWCACDLETYFFCLGGPTLAVVLATVPEQQQVLCYQRLRPGGWDPRSWCPTQQRQPAGFLGQVEMWVQGLWAGCLLLGCFLRPVLRGPVSRQEPLSSFSSGHFGFSQVPGL